MSDISMEDLFDNSEIKEEAEERQVERAFSLSDLPTTSSASPRHVELTGCDPEEPICISSSSSDISIEKTCDESIQIIGSPYIEPHIRRKSSSDCEFVAEIQELDDSASEKDDKEEFSCPICMESYRTILGGSDDNGLVSTICGHVFCSNCLKHSLKNSSKKTCPVCTMRLTSRNSVHKLYL